MPNRIIGVPNFYICNQIEIAKTNVFQTKIRKSLNRPNSIIPVPGLIPTVSFVIAFDKPLFFESTSGFLRRPQKFDRNHPVGLMFT